MEKIVNMTFKELALKAWGGTIIFILWTVATTF